MPAKKKKGRGGRVTPKGTTNPPKKNPTHPAAEAAPDALPASLRQPPRKAMREKGRGARPVTHNRGNR